MHLENPIWHALTTEQGRFAEVDGDAARFSPSVSPLAGLRTPGAAAALALLLAPGELAGLFVDAPIALPSALRTVETGSILQLVHEGPAPHADEVDLVELGPDDVPAMLALAAATRPGPFVARTAELGTFLGIRVGGQLVAMAGQRLRLPGLVEVSAVCTDPAHVGRGHAARLLQAQLARIHTANAGAFLHVRDENTRAIGLYERLGFRVTRRFTYQVICRGQAM